jgi:hypothetical protein
MKHRLSVGRVLATELLELWQRFTEALHFLERSVGKESAPMDQ